MTTASSELVDNLLGNRKSRAATPVQRLIKKIEKKRQEISLKHQEFRHLVSQLQTILKKSDTSIEDAMKIIDTITC